MAQSSVYNSILDAVVAQEQALGIDWNGVPIPVKKRKLPAADEELDALPIICVVPDETPESVEVFDSGVDAGRPSVEVGYRVEVALIAAGNQDFASGLDSLLGWREPTRRLFSGGVLPGVSQSWRTAVAAKRPVDPALVNQSYDYSVIAGIVYAVETA